MAILLLFCLILTICIFLSVPLPVALFIGVVLFIIYAIHRHVPSQTILKLLYKGVLSTFPVLRILVLIGCLTGVWRCSGTIASLIVMLSKLLSPSWFYPAVFIVSGIISVLLGSSFGTASTFGTISMVLSNALGLNPMITGGAVLSGAFVGDRCSPVSSSASVVAALTDTDLSDNLRNMMKSALPSTIITIIIYAVLGLVSFHGSVLQNDLTDIFTANFRTGVIALIPAAFIILLPLFHAKTIVTISFSIAAAGIIAVLYQGISIPTLFKCIIYGYHPADPELSNLLGGGGILSMVNVILIVAISSSYSGLFEETGLLKDLQHFLLPISKRISVFGCIVLVSIFASLFSCNQTFTIILVNDLCRSLVPDKSKLALYLEDSSVLLPALIPWNIAGHVPLVSCGAPGESVIYAFYLVLVPLAGIIKDFCCKKDQ